MNGVFSGSAIMYGALLVFDSDFIHIVSISFTALIVTELIMVALTIHTWHWAMLLAQVYIWFLIVKAITYKEHNIF